VTANLFPHCIVACFVSAVDVFPKWLKVFTLFYVLKFEALATNNVILHSAVIIINPHDQNLTNTRRHQWKLILANICSLHKALASIQDSDWNFSLLFLFLSLRIRIKQTDLWFPLYPLSSDGLPKIDWLIK
jgi:hypothetical protein